MRTLKAGVVAIGPDLSKFAVTRSTLDGVHQIHYLIIIWAKLYTINIHVMRGSVLQPHLGGEVGRRDTDAKVNKYQVAEYMLSYHDNHRNNIENPNKVQYSLFEIVQLRRLNVYKYGLSFIFILESLSLHLIGSCVYLGVSSVAYSSVIYY